MYAFFFSVLKLDFEADMLQEVLCGVLASDSVGCARRGSQYAKGLSSAF